MSDSNLPNDVLAQHDPSTLLARENADLRRRLAEMETRNVVEGRFRGELPRYRLNEPCFLDDTWFPAETELDWTEAPNLEMVPLNEPAQIMIKAEFDRQTEGAKRKAALSGREFFGLTTERGEVLGQALADARYSDAAPRPVIPTRKSEIPAMPHTEAARQIARRRPGRPAKVSSITPPSSLAPIRSVPTELAPTTVRGPAMVG